MHKLKLVLQSDGAAYTFGRVKGDGSMWTSTPFTVTMFFSQSVFDRVADGVTVANAGLGVHLNVNIYQILQARFSH